MLTKTQHLSYKKYAQMIIVKCNNLTRNNLIINVEVVNVNRGKAWRNAGENFITIPVWSIERGFAFFTQYIIHEYNHFNVGGHHGHDDIFKKSESHLCQKLINCKLIYSKAYVTMIINNKDNKVLYHDGYRTNNYKQPEL